MFINKIRIQNYRNFNDFTMEFHQGLNVIIGANNSGKTGLLYAIKLLNRPLNISIHDFNKNNLVKYNELYLEEAPTICIEYFISHRISEEDTNDESIIKLLPFLGIKEFERNRTEVDGKVEYNIGAEISARYALDAKYLGNYKAEVATVTTYEDYLMVLNRFIENHYSWSYTNGISDTKADAKSATEIFDIRFIEAERTSDDVRKETKKEIDNFSKDTEHIAEFDAFKKKVSKELSDLLAPSIQKLSNLFENEHNEIGLEKGNVAISSNITANFSIADTYITEIKDTTAGYILPLQNNGLGYNNLVNIYMLVKLTEIKKGKDFRILCLEEPEAHLHPAMQYKLFKYLKGLDDNNQLNQQIFVTTHSSNISAVAGIDNMFMLAYNRVAVPADCVQQSLKLQFIDQNGETKKAEAKSHLTKFLDVTRSDMLFADKVILVEGIAEKLLMPLFMEKCAIPYEDEHISIVEIGGKHFEHFVELFNNNSVKKKVLCITDNDFDWIEDGKLKSYDEYIANVPNHIEKLKLRFPIDNFFICTQFLGGRTFEDELFLTNMENDEYPEVKNVLFKSALSDTVKDFFVKYGFNIEEWITHKDEIDGRSKKTVSKYIEAYQGRSDMDDCKKAYYNKISFSEMFLHYASGCKGDIALQILTDPDLFQKDENGTVKSTRIAVPKYIQEGLEWLVK